MTRERFERLCDEVEELIDAANDVENAAAYPPPRTVGNALRRALEALREAAAEAA